MFWNTWTIPEMAKWIVIVAAIVAVVYIALRKFGITIPDWIRQICIVIFVAMVAILAIRFLASL